MDITLIKNTCVNQVESDNAVNTYDIFDTRDNKYIIRNATALEIADKYSIQKQMVYQYQARGYLLEKRFLIKINTKVDDSFKKQWDRARFKINPSARRG